MRISDWSSDVCSSDLPRLYIGDYLFVSKWNYGYSKHSLPFSLPLIPGRVFSRLPARGDVVVFKAPPTDKQDYIKRVIGLPGDRSEERRVGKGCVSTCRSRCVPWP